jgi:hypothetical protein
MVTEAEIEAAIEAFHQKRVATRARGWMRLSIKAALEAAERIRTAVNATDKLPATKSSKK